jgi:hypothetical protein
MRCQVRRVAGAAVSVRRWFSATAALLGAALAVAGCGAQPYQYVGSVNDHMFFKVPSAWRQLSAGQVARLQRTVLGSNPAGPGGGQLVWSAAFDAAAHPSGDHIFAVTNEPTVYASVQIMNPSLRDGMSFDVMRDLLVPVTPQRRRQLAAAGIRLPPLITLTTPATFTASDGIRGISEAFEVTLSRGIKEDYTQTVLTNGDTTKLYLLVIQCDQACFQANLSQIGAVVQSFTVKGS